MAEITLRHLAHSYLPSPAGPEDYAIREMDHIWHQGGAYALLGPSGCGKSTLLNIISGLLEPSSGEVLFDGERVNSLAPEQRNIAQVFQFPVVYDTMTVFDNLAFPLRNTGMAETKIREKVLEVAEVLELTPQLKRKAKNLTADEKQKVSMGRGLVREDVSAILFDEPLTVIDPQLKWKLRRKLKEIHRRFNITMVYVTHDQLEASTFADKIAVMYQGQVVQFGTPRELYERPAHTFVGYFIGSPGMNLLDISVKDDQVRCGEVVIPVTPRMRDLIAQSDSSNIRLGIRPDFVEVFETPEADALTVDVVNAQDLGTYSILTLALGDITLKARINEDQPTPKGKAYIRFPQARLGVYIDEYRVETDHE